MITRLCFGVVVLVGTWAVAQDTSSLSARTLFYTETPDQEKPPPVSQAKKPAGTQFKTANSGTTPGTAPDNAAPGQTKAVTSPSATPVALTLTGAAPAPVSRLGLRYGIWRVDTSSGNSEPVDPDQTFRPGDCLQLEFESNRSGYLYVLSQGSSGKWQPLLPSAMMPDESNALKSRKAVRLPEKHCFEIEAGSPGTDRVFVVLSRDAQDLYDLHQSMRRSADPELAPDVRPTQQMLLTQNVDRFRAGLGSRDLRIHKVARAESPNEAQNSVYVVNASNKPSDRVVTEIRIRHE